MADKSLPVTIVICVRNRAAELAACLDSLRHADVSQILVVDDLSTDNTREVARSRGAQIVSTQGRGLGYARQTGVLAANEPYLLFLDSDMAIPDQNTVNVMLDELNGGDYAGLQAMIRADSTRNIWERTQDIHWQLTFNRPGPRSSIGCGGTLFRRDVLLRCSPDPFFNGAAEDGDLSHRIVKSGGRLAVASVSVIHAHRCSFHSLWKQRLWYGRGNARRAWKDQSPRHLLGPVLTAAYLTWQGLWTQNLCLLPYAVVHGFAGIMGEVAEGWSLLSASLRASLSANDNRDTH